MYKYIQIINWLFKLFINNYKYFKNFAFKKTCILIDFKKGIKLYKIKIKSKYRQKDIFYFKK